VTEPLRVLEAATGRVTEGEAQLNVFLYACLLAFQSHFYLNFQD
jgi:hypothetical protein